MARIFSISFSHAGMEQHAMVTVRTTPFFTEYSISLREEDLAQQLPNNKIISTSKNHFTFSDGTDENNPDLMQDVLQAVAHHLQSIQA